MKELLSQLTPSNWVQIFSTVATLIVSVVSITIANSSLKQTKQAAIDTKKSEFNATRPYVTIYSNVISTGIMSIHKFLIIKNFGKTAAQVKSIEFSPQLDKSNQERNLASLHNFVLAPGMSIRAEVDQKFGEVVTFKVKYCDFEMHKFYESYNVNFGFENDVRYSEADNSALPAGVKEIVNALNIIAQQLQD